MGPVDGGLVVSAERSAGPSVLITWHNELETWGPPIDLDALYPALRQLWDGTDRGELKALLVEAWGPSPGRTIHPMVDKFTRREWQVGDRVKVAGRIGVLEPGRECDFVIDPVGESHHVDRWYLDECAELIDPVASNLRAPAARESQLAEPKLETGPAPPCADPDCPCHEHDLP